MTERVPRILIVDDQDINIDLLTQLLAPRGYILDSAHSGAEALQSIEQAEPDVILLDLVMPEMDGYEVCRRVKRNPDTRHIPIIIISGVNAESVNVKALEAGADEFLQRPFNIVFLEARIRNCIRSKMLQDQIIQYQRQLEHQNEELENGIRQRTAELARTQHATVFSLAKLAESRDPETGEHLDRIRRYAQEIALHLADQPAYGDAIDSGFIETLYYSSPLHDIGKVGIPDRILLKRGPLSDEEFDIMRSHTIVGGETLTAAEQESGHNPLLVMGRDIAFGHHEKWDGTGYPEGLAGEDIPLAARIVALADVYDALRSKRPYKQPFTHEAAKEILLRGRESHFDPAVVDAFVARESRFIGIQEMLQDTGAPTRIEQIMETLDALERRNAEEEAASMQAAQ